MQIRAHTPFYTDRLKYDSECKQRLEKLKYVEHNLLWMWIFFVDVDFFLDVDFLSVTEMYTHCICTVLVFFNAFKIVIVYFYNIFFIFLKEKKIIYKKGNNHF